MEEQHPHTAHMHISSPATLWEHMASSDYTFSRDTVWFFGKAYRWVTDDTTGQILLRLDESYPILFTRGARRAYAAYQRQQIFTPDGMS